MNTERHHNAAARRSNRTGYLPGLDGLRAFAILGVLMAHDTAWTLFGYSNAKWKGYGGWGVELFFAISGVLICWRLFEEEQRSGKLHLRSFYVRRLFRIQPAAVVYLLTIAGLFAVDALPSSWHLWWSALFSYTNFVINIHIAPATVAFLGHFWTLSVEEHFYLLLSVLFAIRTRHRPVLLGLVLLALWSGQTIAERHGLFSPVVSTRRTYWIIQLLLFPAWLSALVRQPRVQNFVERYLRPWVASLAIGTVMALRILWTSKALFLAQVRHFSPLFFVAFNLELVFYCFGVWVIAIMLHPASFTTRLLEWAPLRWLGRLSYSLYLWHALLFIPALVPEVAHSRTVLLLSGRPWRYLVTLGLAMMSFYCVERPFIRWGHRVAPPATDGHADLHESKSGTSELAPA